MNVSKAKGTRAESLVVAAALEAGLPARRVALAGNQDQGDVHVGHPTRVVIEVKAGNAAATASHNQVVAWFAEAETEAGRVASADMAVLVVKRKGKGKARDWRAFTTLADYAHVMGRGEPYPMWATDRMVEMPLGWLLDDLARARLR